MWTLQKWRHDMWGPIIEQPFFINISVMNFAFLHLLNAFSLPVVTLPSSDEVCSADWCFGFFLTGVSQLKRSLMMRRSVLTGFTSSIRRRSDFHYCLTEVLGVYTYLPSQVILDHNVFSLVVFTFGMKSLWMNILKGADSPFPETSVPM